MVVMVAMGGGHDRLLGEDRSALLDSIRSCAKLQDLRKARCLHSQILRHKLFPHEPSLHHALLSMYMDCSALDLAQAVFDALPARNVVAWSALISGFARHGRPQDALLGFRKMQEAGVPPNEVTFVSALKSCSALPCLKVGEEIHVRLIGGRGSLLRENVILGNALIDMYARCGMLREARHVFDELPVRNVVTWNVLITCYSNRGLAEEVLICFDQMRGEGLTPDAVTFISVLKACGALGFLELGEEAHAEVAHLGLLETQHLSLGTAIVDMYAKCGMLAKARQVFSEMPRRNVVTWSALISGYAQHGLGEEAMACFEQMQSERIIPDAVTFVSVLKACGITGSVRMGEKLHSQIRARGLTSGKEVFLGTALVDMYAKCAALDKAQEAFEELQAPNMVSWNVLISGYVQLGQTEAVSGSFRKMMMDESLHPNAATFVILLTLCTHAGLVKEGKRLFDAMDEKTLDHYVCIIDLYGRAGLFAEAVAMIGRVPQPDRLPLWLVFLAACYRCINLEPGRLAFEHILQLDDRCTSAHVCMANTYASCST